MMLDLVNLSLFFIVAFIVWFWRWERSDFVRKIDLIPGPSGKLPVVGNALDFPPTGHDLSQALFVRWVKEYGPVYRLWRGMHPMVMLSSPETIEVVMSCKQNINKSIAARSFIPWIGEGLLLASGDKWRQDRRLLTPAFHFQLLNDCFEVFNRNSDIFVEQIANKLETGSEMDIASMASKCTLDIICEAAMGKQINAQSDSGCDSDYIKATESIELKLQQKINSALSILPDWFYYKFTAHGRECKRLLDLVHDFTTQVIKERKEEMFHSEPEALNKRRKPFLQLLLETEKEGVGHLSDKEIMTQVDTFMFAGHDTTAGAITWFLYCMATHHDEQDRVYQEIYDYFGELDRPCTLEDLPKLKYLDCCLKESMRVHPSVAIIRRRINEELNVGGYIIPAETDVQMQIYAAHHDENHFPDPYTFKPERFLPENSVGRHPYAFVPFSAGPRNCIGQKFATYENKVILIHLISKYRFDIDPRHYPVKESLNITLKPENGMTLLITSRQL